MFRDKLAKSKNGFILESLVKPRIRILDPFSLSFNDTLLVNISLPLSWLCFMRWRFGLSLMRFGMDG